MKMLVLFMSLVIPIAASAQGLTITPASQTIVVGANQQFKAVDSTGKDVSTQVTWSTSNSAVAMIGAATGMTVGIAGGSATITASMPGTPPPQVNNFTFALTPTSLVFPSWQIGTPLPVMQNLLIDNIGPNGTHTDWTATAPTWVTLSQSSGVSKTPITVGVKSVAVGTYTGNIVISSPEAPTVSVPVTWTVTAAQVTVPPTVTSKTWTYTCTTTTFSDNSTPTVVCTAPK